MHRGFKAFCKAEEGSSTIQFVVMFLAFISVMTFVVQTAIYLYAVTSIQKAAEAGVRLAVISQPVTGRGVLLNTTRPNNNYEFGERCRTPQANGAPTAGDPCERFAEQVCGPGRDRCGGQFGDILSEMQGYNGNIERRHVTISYTDVGIGFAGAPRRPMVTVTVAGLNIDAGLFGLLLSFAGERPPGENLSMLTLPPAVASMPAESLGQ